MASFYQDTAEISVIREQPVLYVENVWGQNVRGDPKHIDQSALESMRATDFSRLRQPTAMSLPHRTAPRLIFNRNDRMVPDYVQESRVCIKQQIEERGPWYSNYLPMVDAWPIKPSQGDLTKDPRYLQDHTRSFARRIKTMQG